MICYSHPEKELMYHLKNVKEIGLSVFEEKTLKSLNEFKYILETVLHYHDVGKATKFFQDYLSASIENRDCEHSKKLTSHALLSACVGAYKTYNSISSENNPSYWAILSFIAIRKHHGNLEELNNMLVISKNDWQNLEKQWQNLQCGVFKKEDVDFFDLKNIIEEFLWEKDTLTSFIESFFLLNFIFSVLIYADKTEVIIGKKNFTQIPENFYDIVDTYKIEKLIQNRNSEINEIREQAYNVCENEVAKYKNEKIFSINLPTGSGKTLTVFNTAFKLLKKEPYLKRIIYALPFTSIIDQTEKVFREILEVRGINPDKYLTVHHHLSEAKIEMDEGYIEGEKAQFLIENWDNPIILTTFWQLFYSIVTGKNSQLRKFHNIANSVIILDEVQSIPYKYWYLIKNVLQELSTFLNCKIIFLTATMPLIFENDEIISLVPSDIRETFFSKFSRYKIINELKDITINELLNIAINDIDENPEKSFLFVFNTISNSIKFYKLLKENLEDKTLIYLSSNILPVERKKRIEEIKKRSDGKIIVSTQVIEAGVDIDIDIVYRDFAPLDSIIQTAGRCNRNNRKEQGLVKLFKLTNDKGKHDFSYIYKGLPINATNKIFEKKTEINENNIFHIINEYYDEIKRNKSNNESNILLNALENLDYDTITSNFKLLDEPPSFSVFIEIDDKSKKLLKEFYNILKIEDVFDRKEAFLKIKSDFYQYILSVNLNNKTKSYFQDLQDIGGIKIVSSDLKESIYNDETGLVRELSIFI